MPRVGPGPASPPPPAAASAGDAAPTPETLAAEPAAPEPGSGGLSGYRWSPAVLAKVVGATPGATPGALLRAAATADDGNRYLNRSELEAGAAALAESGQLEPPLRHSPAVLARVMAEHGLEDGARLLREGRKHDANGNRYLDRSELSAAAVALSGPELGFVSDLDKTIIPPHDDALPAAPYPGVAPLLKELDLGDGKKAGDAYYVTARNPSTMHGVTDWLDAHGLPSGVVETGISGVPWIAENEKVKDISAIFDAHPSQRFVLLGDSNHRDPEVFQRLKAKYGTRVIAAFVHVVKDTAPARLAGLDPIGDYAEAATVLLTRGALGPAAARRVLLAAQSEGLPLSDADIDARLAAATPG